MFLCRHVIIWFPLLFFFLSLLSYPQWLSLAFPMLPFLGHVSCTLHLSYMKALLLLTVLF